MVQNTAKLGGTASDVTVGRVAHGLMMMTWDTLPDDQTFGAIKAGIDALPAGTKAFLNSGAINATYYPEYADKTFLSVKGALKSMKPDNSPESIRNSVDNIQKALGPIKKIDLFQPARIDRKVPVQDLMQTLATLVKEGKFSHVGLSECNADTLRKAHGIYPVTAVEIEISPFSYEENQRKVLSTAAELGISVLAYSPLGRGLLTGKIKSQADMAEGDPRHRFTRFKEENMKHNLAIVGELEVIAQGKGLTIAQLCIAWVTTLGPNVIPLPGSSKSTRTLENLEGGEFTLSPDEVKEINGIVAKYGVKGDRYIGLPDDVLDLWG
ncbi:aldo/keto reductase [Mycena crocata]|nr:aldo/keto reductase [Mycena crocata]